MEKHTIIDLEHITISPAAYRVWMEIASTIWPQLIAILWDSIWPEDIPDEQFRIYPDGSGEIFVTLPNDDIITLRIPPDHRTYSSTPNN